MSGWVADRDQRRLRVRDVPLLERLDLGVGRRPIYERFAVDHHPAGRHGVAPLAGEVAGEAWDVVVLLVVSLGPMPSQVISTVTVPAAARSDRAGDARLLQRGRGREVGWAGAASLMRLPAQSKPRMSPVRRSSSSVMTPDSDSSSCPPITVTHVCAVEPSGGGTARRACSSAWRPPQSGGTSRRPRRRRPAGPALRAKRATQSSSRIAVDSA
jgi:hypothetical protein